MIDGDKQLNNAMQAIKWLLEGKRIRPLEWKNLGWYVRYIDGEVVNENDEPCEIWLQPLLECNWEVYKDEYTEMFWDKNKDEIIIKEVDRKQSHFDDYNLDDDLQDYWGF